MKASGGTIARTIILALALLNQILTMTGHSMIVIDDETIQELVSTIITIVAAIAAWWKNNSFTEHAITADAYMQALKNSDFAIEDEESEDEDTEESDDESDDSEESEDDE